MTPPLSSYILAQGWRIAVNAVASTGLNCAVQLTVSPVMPHNRYNFLLYFTGVQQAKIWILIRDSARKVPLIQRRHTGKRAFLIIILWNVVVACKVLWMQRCFGYSAHPPFLMHFQTFSRSHINQSWTFILWFCKVATKNWKSNDACLLG